MVTNDGTIKARLSFPGEFSGWGRGRGSIYEKGELNRKEVKGSYT